MKKRTMCATAIAGAAVGAYAGYFLWTYARFGQRRPSVEVSDPLLDQFMPEYDVAEQHHIDVNAPADVTFAMAARMDLRKSPVARALFAIRELPIRLTRSVEQPADNNGLLEEALSMGWGILAQTAREVVVGSVTRPWVADVQFRALPPEQFAAFAEPEFVKIAWTLAADARGEDRSVFRTETRVQTTDAVSREKFRRYLSALSPGILMIRREGLRIVKHAAEAVPRQQATVSA